MFKFLKKRRYIISKWVHGVEYYNTGSSGVSWTPLLFGAKLYKKQPKFDWIDPEKHSVEKYYI